MSREWKPGEVAMVTGEFKRNENSAAIAVRVSAGWTRLTDGAFVRDPYVLHARPVIVVDPEQFWDIPQSLRQAANALRMRRRNQAATVCAALAEVVDYQLRPRSVRPEEPQGLGAVVEDADGCRWVRSYLLHGTGWVSRDETYGHGYWPDMSVVRVLSEGVPWGAAS